MKCPSPEDSNRLPTTGVTDNSELSLSVLGSEPGSSREAASTLDLSPTPSFVVLSYFLLETGSHISQDAQELNR